ncbi:MAG: ribosomal L7Ae/L30e/S12e/Gadd45 family protein [Candidatus Woesearchaeota archaeon]
MADIVTEIKKLIKEDKLVIGADETLKGLRKDRFEKIFLAGNCPEILKSDIEHLASLSEVEIVDTGIQNTELGDICKKPFAISVMGLVK